MTRDGRAIWRATVSARSRGAWAECHAAALAAGISTMEERAEWIKAGARRWPLATMGRVFGLSRQRVFQIVRGQAA